MKLEIAKDGVEETFDDLGIRSKLRVLMNENVWLWGDEHVGIFSMVNEGFVEGEVFKEKVMTAFTVVDKYQISVYIANELNSDDDFEVLI